MSPHYSVNNNNPNSSAQRIRILVLYARDDGLLAPQIASGMNPKKKKKKKKRKMVWHSAHALPR